VPPGGEQAVARELEALAGVSHVAPEAGGVAFEGTLEAALRANLWLRGATRVLLRVGQVRARDFDALRRGAAALGWRELLPEGARVALSVSQRGSRLYHTGAIVLASRAADAEQTVFVRGVRDRWTFSLDASGERLDRRGWRLERGTAAVRETLASLVLSLCGWEGEQPLVDPFCGSGTFAIEAALRALRAAPGAGRSFACERWRCAEPALAERLRSEALARRREAAPAPIVAADRSARALVLARRNAERAGVAAAIRFERAAFDALEAPAPAGLLVLDPPYGRREGSRGEARAGYAALARALRPRWAGWRAGILAPEPRLLEAFPGRRAALHVLPHGGLRVSLCVLEL
jgi:putative N6-adenine-specific DNA methylase